MEQYVYVLMVLYGIIPKFEHELARYVSSSTSNPNISGFLEATSWARSHLLERDLVALGVRKSEIRDLPRCAQIPQCDTLVEALAILYLLQGSRLGGKVIAANVKTSLGLDERSGCSYFSSNGSDVNQYWSACKAFIEVNVDLESETMMIESVKRCFMSMETWFKGASRP